MNEEILLLPPSSVENVFGHDPTAITAVLDDDPASQLCFDFFYRPLVNEHHYFLKNIELGGEDGENNLQVTPQSIAEQLYRRKYEGAGLYQGIFNQEAVGEDVLAQKEGALAALNPLVLESWFARLANQRAPYVDLLVQAIPNLIEQESCYAFENSQPAELEFYHSDITRPVKNLILAGRNMKLELERRVSLEITDQDYLSPEALKDIKQLYLFSLERSALHFTRMYFNQAFFPLLPNTRNSDIANLVYKYLQSGSQAIDGELERQRYLGYRATQGLMQEMKEP